MVITMMMMTMMRTMLVTMMMMVSDGAWWDFRLHEHHRGCVHKSTSVSEYQRSVPEYISVPLHIVHSAQQEQCISIPVQDCASVRLHDCTRVPEFHRGCVHNSTSVSEYQTSVPEFHRGTTGVACTRTLSRAANTFHHLNTFQMFFLKTL